MPSKSLRIPIAALGEAGRIEFLELWIKPLAQSPSDSLVQPNPFGQLAQPGLEEAIAAAHQAWSAVAPPGPVKVSIASPGFGLTNSAGAALGLALCPFLAAPDAPYKNSLVMGGLAFDKADVGVSAVDQLATKLRAIRAQGYQVEPVLLIYADDGDPETHNEASQLAALNIAVRCVTTFREACRVCDGSLTNH